MEDNSKWFALYTRSRWEKKVVQLLTREKFVTYCPLNRVMRQWSDRKKLLYEPLFTCYVFVQLHDVQEMAVVKSINGVINFVCCLNKPAVIRNEEIDIIKKFLNDYDSVRLEKVQVDINDIVSVSTGPLMKYEGSVISVSRNKVKVFLPTLGYAMVAEVNKENLLLIKKAII